MKELIDRLLELQSLVHCWHLDMGGKDRYSIKPENYDRIGKLINESLYLVEYICDNPNDQELHFRATIMRHWDRDRIEKFAKHLLGDKCQLCDIHSLDNEQLKKIEEILAAKYLIEVKNDPNFTAFVRAIPDKHWSKYDLSAVRLGWEAHKLASLDNFEVVEECRICKGSGVLPVNSKFAEATGCYPDCKCQSTGKVTRAARWEDIDLVNIFKMLEKLRTPVTTFSLLGYIDKCFRTPSGGILRVKGEE